MKCDENQVHIGVDVSKGKLDIFVPAREKNPRAELKTVENNNAGYRIIRDLARKNKAVVCVEPTGGYELGLIAFMLHSKVQVAYTDAARVRQFAKAEGTQSKNDHLDAALISRFADKIGVRLIEAKESDIVELKRKTKLRQTYIDIRTILIGKLEIETDPDASKMIKSDIARMDRNVKKIEADCRKIVKGNENIARRAARFTQVDGVGETTAVAILAGLPEIGTLKDEELFKMVGLAPIEKQSGTKEWQRRIWGGRKDVRNALYMATQAALTWNSIISSYYWKKRNEGHSHKWAMVPAMRKLLSLLNRIARDPDFTPRSEPESTKKNAKVGRKKKAA